MFYLIILINLFIWIIFVCVSGSINGDRGPEAVL